METTRNSRLGAAIAAAVLGVSATAWADGPMMLTGKQLDRVTAGAATVISSVDAQAAGAFALTNTTANSLVTSGTPYPKQPELQNSTAVADGTATAVGTNLGITGAPPPSSGTSVVTAGVADGNLVINSTVNRTLQGAGGVTFQAGWTFVYGAWVGI
ncbi:MAG TPA: hypothetical protein VFW56_09570 [Bradyrhizobium sp.]|nr:hypothetical protein [Bradyrhizobium sp.]